MVFVWESVFTGWPSYPWAHLDIAVTAWDVKEVSCGCVGQGVGRRRIDEAGLEALLADES